MIKIYKSQPQRSYMKKVLKKSVRVNFGDVYYQTRGKTMNHSVELRFPMGHIYRYQTLEIHVFTC